MPNTNGLYSNFRMKSHIHNSQHCLIVGKSQELVVLKQSILRYFANSDQNPKHIQYICITQCLILMAAKFYCATVLDTLLFIYLFIRDLNSIDYANYFHNGNYILHYVYRRQNNSRPTNFSPLSDRHCCCCCCCIVSPLPSSANSSVHIAKRWH